MACTAGGTQGRIWLRIPPPWIRLALLAAPATTTRKVRFAHEPRVLRLPSALLTARPTGSARRGGGATAQLRRERGGMRRRRESCFPVLGRAGAVLGIDGKRRGRLRRARDAASRRGEEAARGLAATRWRSALGLGAARGIFADLAVVRSVAAADSAAGLRFHSTAPVLPVATSSCF